MVGLLAFAEFQDLFDGNAKVGWLFIKDNYLKSYLPWNYYLFNDVFPVLGNTFFGGEGGEMNL